MIGAALKALLAALTVGSAGSRGAGLLGTLGIVGAVVAGGVWLLGPGREIQLTLNLLELSAVMLFGGALVLFALWQKSPRDDERYQGRG
mgnify:FL=1